MPIQKRPSKDAKPQQESTYYEFEGLRKTDSKLKIWKNVQDRLNDGKFDITGRGFEVPMDQVKLYMGERKTLVGIGPAPEEYKNNQMGRTDGWSLNDLIRMLEKDPAVKAEIKRAEAKAETRKAAELDRYLEQRLGSTEPLARGTRQPGNPPRLDGKSPDEMRSMNR